MKIYQVLTISFRFNRKMAAGMSSFHISRLTVKLNEFMNFLRHCTVYNDQ